MPSRIVREGINSSRAVSGMPEQAQLFYRTLMLIVDDYGRIELDVDVIRAQCFPRQLDRWPNARIEACLESTCSARLDTGTPLITRYCAESKEFLQVNNFRQRLLVGSKFPPPPGQEDRIPYKRAPRVTRHPDAPPAEPAAQPKAATPDPPAPPVVAAVIKANPRASKNGHAVAVVIPAHFDEFWGLYWRKVGKERAVEAFRNRVRTEEEWQQVRAAVVAQSPEMMGREIGHRPHATTWLNQGRMFDELSPARISPDRGVSLDQRRRDETNAMAKLLRGK